MQLNNLNVQDDDELTTVSNMTGVEMLHTPTESGEDSVPKIEKKQNPPSRKFRVLMDNALRYGCLVHILVQFLFIVLFASLSESVDWSRRVNICFSMFIVVPLLVGGFSSTGFGHNLDLSFKLNIVFTATVLLIGATMCALNIWIIALNEVLPTICLIVNIIVFVALFAISVVRLVALRREILFMKQHNGALVDEI
jgi:hypothetical protein